MTVLRDGLAEGEANQITALLASMGIEARVESDAHSGLAVCVDDADLDAAKRVIGDEIGSMSSDEIARREDVGLVAPKAWLGRGAGAVLGVAAACVAVFVETLRGADAGSRSSLLRLGAIDSTRVADGDYWRLLSGIFLHFDANHLLSNLGVLAIVGPPLAHQIGALRFLVVFLVSGVGGNVASQLLMPTVALKGGASGAITGVLGALGGLSLRPERRRRRKAWVTLGAVAALYGFLVGFDVTSDNVAHLGGLAVGIVLGSIVEPLPSGPVQVALRDD